MAIAAALTAVEAAGLIALQGFNAKVPRAIGGVLPFVVVEERHEDVSRITKHPVEKTASITDHVYREPATVTIRAGWSNSPVASNPDLDSSPDNSLSGLASPPNGIGASSNFIIDIYNQLLTLKNNAQLMSVYTGKRVYPNNMVIERLSCPTDEKHENAMELLITCTELILVTTTLSSVPPPANMATPSNNAAVQNQGTVQPVPAPNANQGALTAAGAYSP